MIAIFLGAGFSYPAGMPLASQLFDEAPEVDRIARQQLVERVLRRWNTWRAANDGSPEEYLAYIQQKRDQAWLDAVWYVALTIALKTGQLRYVGGRPTIVQHGIGRTTWVPVHEEFWSRIFSHTVDISVTTTNFDVLPEQGIRLTPRPRIHRPGFHYGAGSEELEGRGYPSFAHLRAIRTTGIVPLHKLHGSISWSYRNGLFQKYIDCRPAIRGDAAIVAPMINKEVPDFLRPIWKRAGDALKASRTWIVVGYSLPTYDHAVRQLLTRSATKQLAIHVFDPDHRVIERYMALLPSAKVHEHPGLPAGLDDMTALLRQLS